MYLCDGYGSDRVFAFDSATGEFQNKTWGGRSPLGILGLGLILTLFFFFFFGGGWRVALRPPTRFAAPCRAPPTRRVPWST